ncbi:MAG: hypothetical protein AAFR75_02560 [Pseudomonadota bacterium]
MFRSIEFGGSLGQMIDGRTRASNDNVDLVDALDAHIQNHPTATAALLAWCLAHDIGTGPIVAEINHSNSDTFNPSQVMNRCLHRNVRLKRGNAVLSYAELSYRPSLLPTQIRNALQRTCVPFGSLIAPLSPWRETTFSCSTPDAQDLTQTRNGAAVLIHHATVYIQGGKPIARVREFYTSALITGATDAFQTASI